MLGSVHKEQARNDKHRNAAGTPDHTYDRLRSLIRFKFFLHKRHEREAAYQRGNEKEYVVHEIRAEGIPDESGFREHKDPSEEIPELFHIGEVEYTESDDYDKLGVNMFDSQRDLLEPFFPEKRFDQYEQSEIKSPDDVVPRSAVP